MQHLERIYEVVQKNCHISDGWYAQDYGLCTYLLKMREFYRWEKKLGFSAKLSNDDVGEWLSQREALWQTLENDQFDCIPLDNHCYDPFDNEAINQALIPQGLVYSGGYGQFRKPLFFIGRLLRQEQQGQYHIFVADTEYARDLTAPPAMSQGNFIFIRQESVKRSLWERLEEWHWQQKEDYLQKMTTYYNFSQNSEELLDSLVTDQVEMMIAHEKGEVEAGHLLGDAWEEMLLQLTSAKAELIARAVRDHLADCLVTLPNLLQNGHYPLLVLYFTNLKGMRKALFPLLHQYFQQWLQEETPITNLQQMVKLGKIHWLQIASQLLSVYAADPQQVEAYLITNMENMIFSEQHFILTQHYDK